MKLADWVLLLLLMRAFASLALARFARRDWFSLVSLHVFGGVILSSFSTSRFILPHSFAALASCH